MNRRASAVRRASAETGAANGERTATSGNGDGEPGQSDGRRRGSLTYEDIAYKARMGRRSPREFPRLIARAVRLTYRAGRRELAVATALQVLTAAAVGAQLLVGRKVLGSLLAHGRVKGSFGHVLPELGILLGLTVGLSFVQLVQNEQRRLMAELVTKHAFERVLDVAGAADLASFESPEFFDRLQRAMLNGGSRAYQVANGLLGVGTSALAIGGVTFAMFSIAPLLVPLALGAYAPLWFAMTRNSRAFYEFSYRMTKVDRRRLYLLTILTGRDEAKEIRAFEVGQFLRRRHDDLYEERIQGMRELTRQRIVRSVFAAFGTSGLTVVALGVLAFFYVNGRMSLAAAGIAVAAIVQLSARLQTLVSGTGALYEASLFLDDYYAFLEQHQRAQPQPVPTPAPIGFERLRAEDITFTYPGMSQPALRDITVEIGAGEIVALVGENGSGKTTLAKLLAGLYRPDAGRILWDGVDAADLLARGGRAGTTVIFQDFIRYLLAARENIAIGRHDWAEHLDRVVRAAEEAGAHDFLTRLPQGYETLLGREFEGGHELSTGQWQRVALARAFFRDAAFAILDEPTAALDPRAEYELFAHIRTLLQGRSVLLISHRFSSVRPADRIYVLDRGRIREHGTHESLMAAGDLYAELFSLQAAAYLEPR